MKFLFVFLLNIFTLTAFANVPQLYCVSTGGYGAVTQVSLFTNAKGSLRASAEITSQEGFLADSAVFLLGSRLKYDAKSRTISNAKNTIELRISNKALSRDEAYELFPRFKDEEGFMATLGTNFDREFTKYYEATLVNLEYAAPKDSMKEVFKDSFKAGNTQFVCGNFVDIIKE